MTWTKLGDEYGDQCWKLSDAAFRLHTEALVWQNRRHLDGRLAKDEMGQWTKRAQAAAELVEYGWWADEGDHYQIVHHLGWQRTADQWLKQSQTNKANRAKGKTRPVRPKQPQPVNEPSDEPSDERTDEGDRTGQDRKDAYRGSGDPKAGTSDSSPSRSTASFDAVASGDPKAGNSSGPSRCRFCANELPAHMASQRMRGYCHRAACQAEAKADLS